MWEPSHRHSQSRSRTAATATITLRMILRTGPLLRPNSIIPRLPEANTAARKRSDHGAVYSRDVKTSFLFELDEPLLTEFRASSFVSFSKAWWKNAYLARSGQSNCLYLFQINQPRHCPKIADGWEWQRNSYLPGIKTPTDGSDRLGGKRLALLRGVQRHPHPRPRWDRLTSLSILCGRQSVLPQNASIPCRRTEEEGVAKTAMLFVLPRENGSAT